jgi:hypothetical protein
MFTLYSYVLKPNKYNSLMFITFLKLPNSLTHPVFKENFIRFACNEISVMLVWGPSAAELFVDNFPNVIV